MDGPENMTGISNSYPECAGDHCRNPGQATLWSHGSLNSESEPWRALFLIRANLGEPHDPGFLHPSVMHQPHEHNSSNDESKGIQLPAMVTGFPTANIKEKERDG